MRMVLLVLATLAFGYGLYYVSSTGDDYVHIYTAGYSIELSFVFFLILLMVLMAALYWGFRLSGKLWRAPKDLGKWRQRTGERKSQHGLGRGMLKLIEGDWRSAEKFLLSGSAHSEVPAAHYLGAARAAQEQGAVERRDRYLKRAEDMVGDKDIAFAISKAGILHQAGQVQQAIGVLNSVGGVGSRNPQVIAMLVQAADEIGDMGLLESALPAARGFKALPASVMQPMERRLYSARVLEAPAEELDGVWKALPRGARKDADTSLCYTRGLLAAGRGLEAEKVLRDLIKREWDERAVKLYGTIDDAKPKLMLKRAEAWLKAHEDSAVLKLTLGRLAAAAERIEDAETWLKQAAVSGLATEAYAALGKIREETGDGDLALDFYRRGLQALESSAPGTALTSIQKTDQ